MEKPEREVIITLGPCNNAVIYKQWLRDEKSKFTTDPMLLLQLLQTNKQTQQILPDIKSILIYFRG